MLHKDIKNAILKTQHCNRNFDLNKPIPKEDLELFKTAVSQCPSKQNIAFYNVHFIFDRHIIEQIHNATRGFGIDPKNYQTNSQTLANLLVVFEEAEARNKNPIDEYRNEQMMAKSKGDFKEADKQVLRRDRDQAVGIGAGYLNLTAGLLGYVTGCCACFEVEKIKKILSIRGEPLLLMGIGFKDLSRNRREHHLDKNFIFPSFRKQPIHVNLIEDQSKEAVSN